ncbi:hypothetical protein [Streptomyces xanthophaeus]|uniref:Gram-positive cocci surface proteins LPxTG domain-containing protein n=1 Tax=Streptomyces xanthophaeus TaxID=67385 RepID=A0A919GVV1_9ACTN|nr:hypothetical protein [Streptomyces xanthophaeus]GHI85858.1 hypothetical protein Sxan_32220 [Streptomyces xanthophaeus]
MKIKHIAAVAAAAVVGPVLLTTPAMAEEQKQPAVTAPDVQPKDDTAPAAGAAAQTAKAAAAADPAAATSTGTLMGPGVSVQGIPKTGFKADGSWTQLTVKVDNSGHIAVANYTPEISVIQWSGKIKASQVKVERRVTAADGSVSWQLAKQVLAPQNSRAFVYELGTTASVAVGAVHDIDVRISFAADTAVVPFDIASAGVSRTGDKSSTSPQATYKTSIVGATPDSGMTVPTAGPALTVEGLPNGLAAGGAWQDLSIRVDNSGKPALDDFHLYLGLTRPDWVAMKGEQLKVEFYGKNGWQRTELGYSPGHYVVNRLAGFAIPADKAFDVKLRLRFTGDTPLGYAQFRASGTPLTIGSNVKSESRPVLVQILAAAPGTGNKPHPNGGGTTTPINNTGNGNNTGPNSTTGSTGTTTGTGTATTTTGGTGTTGTTGTGTGTTTQTGGQLASTGADAAASWALGGAGVALAMGAALVAGTGRRRRTTV